VEVPISTEIQRLECRRLRGKKNLLAAKQMWCFLCAQEHEFLIQF
jgi:hypothetical protein